MARRLSDRQKRYLEEKAKDPNLSDFQALIRAGYSRASASNPRLVRESIEGIQGQAVEATKDQLAKQLGLTKELILTELLKEVSTSKGTSKSRSIELAIKVLGMFEPEKIVQVETAKTVTREELTDKVKDILDALTYHQNN